MSRISHFIRLISRFQTVVHGDGSLLGSNPHTICIVFYRHYLRARYYDQNVGRFTQMDTWMGINSDPVTLHKYLYANVDPVNMVDPSGYSSLSLSGFGASFNVQGALAATAVAGIGAFAFHKLAAGLVASGQGEGLISTSLGKHLNKKTLGTALATARAKTEERVRRRGRGRRLLFHYTTRAGALAISACRCMITTNFTGATVDGLRRPRGAYATDLAPWNSSLTQSTISETFFGGSRSRVGKLGWFVAVDGASFFPYGVPHEYVKSVANPLQPLVSVDVITIGANPMPLF